MKVKILVIVAFSSLGITSLVSDVLAMTSGVQRDEIVAHQLDCLNRISQSGELSRQEELCPVGADNMRFDFAEASAKTLAVELKDDGELEVSSNAEVPVKEVQEETQEKDEVTESSETAESWEGEPINKPQTIKPRDPASSEKYPSLQKLSEKHNQEFHPEKYPDIRTMQKQHNKMMGSDNYKTWNELHNKHMKLMEEDKWKLEDNDWNTEELEPEDINDQQMNDEKLNTPELKNEESKSDEEGSRGFELEEGDSSTDGGTAPSSHGNDSFHLGNFLYDAFDRDNPLTRWELGGETSFIRYKEPSFMKEEGNMYGVFGSYTHRFQENDHIHSLKDIFSDDSKINLFKVDAKFSWGQVDYESNGTGSIDNINDFMIEARGAFGYDIPIGSRFQTTPYMGLGYRYLNDDSGGMVSTTGARGYEREANYVYLPVGLDFALPLKETWTAGMNFEYDIFLKGKQKSHLGDAVASLNTVENDQKDGYGLRGSFRIMKETDPMDFFVEPFIRYWKIQDSDPALVTSNSTPIGFGLEPANNSTEYGVKLGIRY